MAESARRKSIQWLLQSDARIIFVVDVFQNGVQIDQNQFINTKEGQDAFKDIQKGTILTCAFEYELPDTENTLTIHMSAFDNDEEVTAEQELVLK